MTAVEWLREELQYQFGFVFSDNILNKAKEMEKEQMTIKKCYHPLTQRKYISDIHFECTICGFYDMVTQ